jgi:hypothetical protein
MTPWAEIPEVEADDPLLVELREKLDEVDEEDAQAAVLALAQALFKTRVWR